MPFTSRQLAKLFSVAWLCGTIWVIRPTLGRIVLYRVQCRVLLIELIELVILYAVIVSCSKWEATNAGGNAQRGPDCLLWSEVQGLYWETNQCAH